MREQLQGTDRVHIPEAAFAGMREMEGNGFGLGMGMAAMDVQTKNDALLWRLVARPQLIMKC